MSSVALAGLGVVACSVFARRVSGATQADIAPGESALYAALFAVGTLFATRELAREVEASLRRVLDLTTLLLALTFIAALSLNPLTILACLGVVAVVFALNFFESAAAGVSLQSLARFKPPASDLTPIETDAGVDEAPPASEPAHNGITLVRSTRGCTERVEGSMSLEFEANESLKTLHVPLWPPLSGDPHVECELEGLEGRVRVPLAKRHGFRIEVRLPESIDEPLAGTLRFVATVACRTSAAA